MTILGNPDRAILAWIDPLTHHVVQVRDLALRVRDDREADLVAAKLLNVGDPLVVAAELVTRET